MQAYLQKIEIENLAANMTFMSSLISNFKRKSDYHVYLEESALPKCITLNKNYKENRIFLKVWLSIVRTIIEKYDSVPLYDDKKIKILRDDDKNITGPLLLPSNARNSCYCNAVYAASFIAIDPNYCLLRFPSFSSAQGKEYNAEIFEDQMAIILANYIQFSRLEISASGVENQIYKKDPNNAVPSTIGQFPFSLERLRQQIERINKVINIFDFKKDILGDIDYDSLDKVNILYGLVQNMCEVFRSGKIKNYNDELREFVTSESNDWYSTQKTNSSYALEDTTVFLTNMYTLMGKNACINPLVFKIIRSKYNLKAYDEEISDASIAYTITRSEPLVFRNFSDGQEIFLNNIITSALNSNYQLQIRSYKRDDVKKRIIRQYSPPRITEIRTGNEQDANLKYLNDILSTLTNKSVLDKGSEFEYVETIQENIFLLSYNRYIRIDIDPVDDSGESKEYRIVDLGFYKRREFSIGDTKALYGFRACIVFRGGRDSGHYAIYYLLNNQYYYYDDLNRPQDIRSVRQNVKILDKLPEEAKKQARTVILENVDETTDL